MKKKIIFAAAVISAVIILGITIGAYVLNRDISISTGNVLISENGTCFLIKGNTPVRLSDYSEKNNVLPDLENGDKVLVLHSGIAESYPASTLCRFCIKIGDGSISDIPEEVITTMTELGWLSNASEKIKASDNWEKIEITRKNANFSLSLPEDWEYTESSNENGSFGISFYHCSEPENNVTIEFTKFFGVCGTGLRTEATTINGYKATMGIYDGNPTFNYIVFDETPGFYVIYNNGENLWWQKYENDIRTIFSTIRIAEGIIFRKEAISIAEKYAIGENTSYYDEFDPDTGIWTFTYESNQKSQIIKIDKNGNIV